MIGFPEFFRAAYEGESTGHAPRAAYPWQVALAGRLAAGDAPRVIAVPTGAGKTATIDALLWALAVQADRPAFGRTVGVRIVWAIDRRILVDEVHEHAVRLAARLGAARRDEKDVLHEVATRLQALAGDGASPLVATRWRGALQISRQAQPPFQPEVITSTVAQIGSRLLFRGYGVGERSRAVAGALAGVDTTICLDEAHLVEPFRQTVDAIVAFRRRERTILPGLTAMTLSATPIAGDGSAAVHALTEADEAALGPRLTGEKVVSLVEPETGATPVATLTGAVEAHLRQGAKVLACVVNSVRTALDVQQALARHRPDVERALLIGPQRPADREALLERHRDVLFGGARPDVPLVCVATQTFEVGLDADVDALVTQSASASALVQRLGRLNRAGLRRGEATVVRDTDSSLYAEDEPAAWAWLRSLRREDGTIDASVTALLEARDGRPPARAAFAPALTDEVVELLSQTAPRPAAMADPDVEAFLRGTEEEASADVGVCWRCDLRLRDDRPAARAYRMALLRVLPPDPQEILTLGIARTRALLAACFGPGPKRGGYAKAALLGPDVEGVDDAAIADDAGQAGAGPRFVVLRGRDTHEVSEARDDLRVRDIHPGDVLVLPDWAGGYAEGALAPGSVAPVDDVAADLRASRDGASPQALRLSAEVIAKMEREPGEVLHLAERADRAAMTGDGRAALQTLLEALGPVASGFDAAAKPGPELRRLTPDDRRFDLELDFDEDELGEDPPPSDGVVFAGERARAGPAFVLLRPRARTREEIRPAGTPPPTLEDHTARVAARAGEFAAQASLPGPVAGAVVLAARAHDHGKADPRVQAFFRGGVPALGEAPLAKSVFGTDDVQADRRARVAAGLPRGLRHEIASVAILACALAEGGIVDPSPEVDVELALHLVGTHHGLGRAVPRVPRGEGSQSRAFAADLCGVSGVAVGDGMEGWAEGAWLRRFFGVIESYGAWGTAYLEALVVLADRLVSAEGG